MGKSQFVRKVLCPVHEEKTPSCAVYADGSGYCFVCNKYFKELGEVVELPENKVIEDIAEKIQYIKSLPFIEHRGLLFPYDSTGYYILWPSNDYYKCRRWLSDSGNKYLNPSGVVQPWLTYVKIGTPLLIIVEGEINALSVVSLNLDISVMCPGSAGQFNLNKSKIPLQQFKIYDKIILVADKDSAGTQAVIKLKKDLINYNPDVQINLVSQDYNEILVTNGKEALKSKIKSMAMPCRVSND